MLEVRGASRQRYGGHSIAVSVALLSSAEGNAPHVERGGEILQGSFAKARHVSSAEARSLTVLQLRDLLWKARTAGRDVAWHFSSPLKSCGRGWLPGQRSASTVGSKAWDSHGTMGVTGSRFSWLSWEFVLSWEIRGRELKPDQLKLRLSQVKARMENAVCICCMGSLLRSFPGAVSRDDRPHPGGTSDAPRWQTGAFRGTGPSPCHLKDPPAEDAK